MFMTVPSDGSWIVCFCTRWPPSLDTANTDRLREPLLAVYRNRPSLVIADQHAAIEPLLSTALTKVSRPDRS